MSPNLLLNDVALYSLQIGFLVGLAAFIPAALRLRNPGLKLVYWHILLVVCLLLPLVRPWQQEVINASVDVSTTVLAVAPAAPVQTSRFPRISQTELVLALIAAGALARLVWLAIGLWRLRRYRRHSEPLTAGMGLSWGVEADLRVSGEVSSPVTFGMLRPVVLLPARFPSLDAPTQEAILAHECLHVRRRDWAVTMAEEIVRAVFWFHPAIWWLLAEIQLAREQAVDRAAVEMTNGREEYVDALLNIAGARPPLDLAPAPLFLRKRHLKHRVVSLLKEVRMSKTHTISALAAAVCILAAACWIVTGAFPLSAAPQFVADAPGVSVDLGGASLMHRSSVSYPPDALDKRIEGTVTLGVTLDSGGNVADARVLSGPDELRKAALQSVLLWHFSRKEAGGAKQVSIAFRLPEAAPAGAPGGVVGGIAIPQGGEPVRAQIIPAPTMAPGIVREQMTVAAPGNAPASPELKTVDDEMTKLMTELRDVTLRQDQQAMANLREQLSALAARRQSMQKISGFETFGLSDEASRELLASLPVHKGDAATAENWAKLKAAVREFDEHLSVASSASAAGEVQVRISAPNSAPAQRIRVGGNVQATALIKRVLPLYPPDARAAKIQGKVVLDATIGPDGQMKDLKAVEGHPMLIQPAMEAVRQWVYRPTLLNGNPVEVATQIEVNFTLSQ